jgi:predicted nucleotide-binding protein
VSRSNNPQEIQLRRVFDGSSYRGYFERSEWLVRELREVAPDYYDDFPQVLQEPQLAMSEGPNQYSREQVERLIRDLDQVLEIRANSQHARSASLVAEHRVFITHGHTTDWREVQAFLERDLKLLTVELSQEASGGTTIIEKLEQHAARCDTAVIVMSGDDQAEGGAVKARENVMHEIGFFQGKYGRQRVALLHEDGVNVPTNLSGIVYVPYPRGMVSAGFAVLARELAAMYAE